jgi:hypothetical protein
VKRRRPQNSSRTSRPEERETGAATPASHDRKPKRKSNPMSMQSIDLCREQLYKEISYEKNTLSIRKLSTEIVSDAGWFQERFEPGSGQILRLYERIFLMQRNLEALRRAVFEHEILAEETIRTKSVVLGTIRGVETLSKITRQPPKRRRAVE